MTTRPGYVWDATASEWVEIGQAAVLAPVKYQATAPTSPATGDIWIESDVDVPSIDSAQFLRWRKTMAGGETSLSGNDDNSLPLQYTPGYEQLYINGVLMVRGQDYTATTGTTVTGLTALVASDVVEIFSAVARTVADVYTQTQSDARFVNKTVGGLNLVIPTSVTGGTVSANGAITMGTSITSVTVNGAFSAAYDAYKIIVTGGSGSVSNAVFALQLGSTNTNYNWVLSYAGFASGGPSYVRGNATSLFNYLGNVNTDGLVASIELQNPFLAKNTFVSAPYADTVNTGMFTGYQNSTTSFTSFTLSSANSFTGGTIRIYGYNNGA
jgi:hypothetical protein